MEFSSLYFLYVFLPLTLAVYFLIPGMKRKNIVLLVASFLLYASGQPIALLLLVGLSYGNYALAKRIQPGNKKSLILPVAVNLAVLAIFKYLDFFLGIFGVHTAEGGLLLGLLRSMTQGLNKIGFSFGEVKTALPIGLSFYVFQVISYLADVYKEKLPAETSFQKLLLYLTMFPKMAQGPITRYEQLEPQLENRRTTPRAAFEGAQRFVFGLGKKVLLADYAGKVVSAMALDGSAGTFVGAWLSALMFMFQIYFDFSGYTDMAIGLGRIFGFRYAENFNLPYTSSSITDFWRRWHMTLGSFFRDYVYIPLGGNRRGKARQILNLFVVWALTGLWHGAAWNFVLWGLYFFVLLAIEKQIQPMLERWPRIFADPTYHVPGSHRLGDLLPYESEGTWGGAGCHVRRRHQLRRLRRRNPAGKLSAASDPVPGGGFAGAAVYRAHLERASGYEPEGTPEKCGDGKKAGVFGRYSPFDGAPALALHGFHGWLHQRPVYLRQLLRGNLG